MDEELVQAARDARKNAYAPYSHFHVGAALRTEDGPIVIGVNVENASYPLGMCAERAAIYAAVAAGYRRFQRIAIVGPGPDVIAPCGGCRQVLSEFGDLEVIMAESSGRKIPSMRTLWELLPMSFRKEDLDGL